MPSPPGTSLTPPVIAPPTSRGPKRARLAAALLLPLLGLTGLVLYCFDPSRFPFYPVCYFHRVTGLLCPGCGSLRALHQLMHGHFVAAFHLNQLLVVSLPLVVFLFIRALFRSQLHPPFLALKPMWLWSGLGAAVAFGIIRNLPL